MMQPNRYCFQYLFLKSILLHLLSCFICKYSHYLLNCSLDVRYKFFRYFSRIMYFSTIFYILCKCLTHLFLLLLNTYLILLWYLCTLFLSLGSMRHMSLEQTTYLCRKSEVSLSSGSISMPRLSGGFSRFWCMSIRKNAAIKSAFFVPFRGGTIPVAGPSFLPCFLQTMNYF
jgi:hypothetical protein